MKYRFALVGLLAALVSASADTVQNVYPNSSTTTYPSEYQSGPIKHHDIDGSTMEKQVGIEIWDNTGDQMALAIGTNTKLTVPPFTTRAKICIETASVRYRDNGSAATTTSGIPVIVATNPNCFDYSGPLASMSFTAITGSPTADISYYKAH